MVTVDRRWLPLNALLAFDAIGRHLDIAAAAHALNISEAAISRHLVALEGLLGHRLVERTKLRLGLTDPGTMLLPALYQSFDRIEQTLNALLCVSGGRRTLRLHVPPCFAQKLASPIKSAFSDVIPGLHLDIVSRDAAPALGSDIAVRFDRLKAGDTISTLLWMSRLTPACSRELAAAHHGKTLQAFLADAELLHVKRVGEPPAMVWEAFSRHFQLGLKTKRGLSFDTAPLAAQYAMSGDGVALIDVDLCAQDIAAGALVAPFAEMFEDGYGYFLDLAAEDLADPVIARFRSWMIQHLGRDAQRRALLFGSSLMQQPIPIAPIA